MASLNFPSPASDGQKYTLNGVTYTYNATISAWLTTLLQAVTISNTSSSYDTQVIFNNSGTATGAPGLVFNYTANTLIGYNATFNNNLTVSNNLIVAGNVTASIFNGNGANISNIVAYTAVNSAFGVINAAFTQSNNEVTRLSAAYVVANAAFGHSNLTYNAVNSAFGVVNASYTLANNDSTKLSAAYVVANAAFGKANTALQNTTGVFSGSLTTTGTLNDSKGEIRSVPINNQSSAYQLVSSDAGKTVSITTGGVTVPASTFNTGDTIVIYNNSGSSQTITQGSSVTLRFAGTTSTGNRTLGAYGIGTVICVATNTFVVSGAGLQ